MWTTCRLTNWSRGKSRWDKAWRYARLNHGMGRRDWNDWVIVSAYMLYEKRNRQFVTTAERLADKRLSVIHDEQEAEHYRQLAIIDALRDDEGNF